jgi:hypothetical protein
MNLEINFRRIYDVILFKNKQDIQFVNNLLLNESLL